MQTQTQTQTQTQPQTHQLSVALVEQLQGLKDLATTSKTLEEFANLADAIEGIQHTSVQFSNFFPICAHSGLPQYLVKGTAIAAQLTDPQVETYEDLSEALIKSARYHIDTMNPNNMAEVIGSGHSVWEQLDGERIDFYSLFQTYRDSKYVLLSSGEYAIAYRSSGGLAKNLGLSPKLVSLLNRIYHWQTRCLFYDRFFDIELQRKKQTQIALLQSEHLARAQKLVDSSCKWLEEHQKLLRPREVISLLELGFKMSRLSIGLPWDKTIEQAGGGGTGGRSIGTNITSITNTMNNVMGGNSGSSVSGNSGSGVNANMTGVQAKFTEDMKNEEQLLSILHVLQQSGAMNQALAEHENKQAKAEAEAIKTEVIETEAEIIETTADNV